MIVRDLRDMPAHRRAMFGCGCGCKGPLAALGDAAVLPAAEAAVSADDAEAAGASSAAADETTNPLAPHITAWKVGVATGMTVWLVTRILDELFPRGAFLRRRGA